jgi:hypothetical protein
LKRQEGELGKCHASDYSGNPEIVQLFALRAVFGFGFCLLVGFCDAVCVFLLFAGIRVLLSVLHALPLCGAAPTFLCSGKEK